MPAAGAAAAAGGAACCGPPAAAATGDGGGTPSRAFLHLELVARHLQQAVGDDDAVGEGGGVVPLDAPHPGSNSGFHRPVNPVPYLALPPLAVKVNQRAWDRHAHARAEAGLVGGRVRHARDDAFDARQKWREFMLPKMLKRGYARRLPATWLLGAPRRGHPRTPQN